MAPTAPLRTSSRRQGTNNGNLTLGEGGGGGRRSPMQMQEAFSPAADTQTYRDLLIFEERLKQNAARLVKRKNKYQSFLFLLCLTISFFGYNVFLNQQEWQPLHYLNVTILLVTATMLFLFFASGMYGERISAANKFVPQANRSLRSFNMYLNLRKAPTRTISSYFISTSNNSSSKNASPDARSAASASNNSNNDNLSIGETRQVMSRQASTAAARRTQIATIPPTSNPRGELIFSPKVSLQFREGYERYRTAFERRRKEKLEERRWKGWKRWWFFSGTSIPVNTGKDLSGTAEKGLHRQATLTPARSSPRTSKARLRASGGGGNGRQSMSNSPAGSESSSRASSRASSPTASLLLRDDPIEETEERAILSPARGRSEEETEPIQRRGRDRTPSVTALSTHQRVTRSNSARDLGVAALILEHDTRAISPDPVSVAVAADDRSAPEATLREPEGLIKEEL